MKKIPKHRIEVDQRTLFQAFTDACASPAVRGFFYLVAALIILVVPIATPLVLIALSPVIFSSRVPAVPLRLPVEANIPDRNDPKPGGEGYNKARGSVFLGNDQFTGAEAWVSWNDQRLHDYAMGATGSGKTETILAINANYALAGSGFLIGDGKGTMMFPKQTATLARLAGGDDDHFVISFLSGYKDQFDRSHTKRSNLINPFGEGNAATVKELLTSLMSDGGGDNAIFADGAASLADSLSPAWVEGRDKGLFEFDITYISQSLALAKVYELSQLKELSELSRTHIRNYLANAGYDFDKPPSEQPENCTRMHGYYVNYFMRVVTSFAISYRHIYLCKQGEVNLRDVVQSHRFLTFTLPSLEKSGDEVSNLGKTLLVSAKAASSYGLGESMEGTREEAVDNLPANYPIPYKFNFDEFSFYVMEDFSLLPAQLRGINISVLLGAQDFIGTTRAGEIDAGSILANARTKFFGALEDSSTFQKLSELVGEVDMLIYSRFGNKGTLGNRIVPEMEVQHTRRSPLDLQELQGQVEGQFHVLQRGRLSRIKTYYPNLNENTVLDNFHLIRLVPSFSPSTSHLSHLKLLKDFVEILSARDAVYNKPQLLNEVVINGEGSADQNAIEGLLNYAHKSRFNVKAHLEAKSKEESSEAGESSTPENNASEGSENVQEAPNETEDLPAYENQGSLQKDVEAAVDEWGSSEFFEDETGPENEGTDEPPTDRCDDDLYRQTQEAANAYFEDSSPESEEGVYALTTEECKAIEKRYEMLGRLLGEPEETAKSSAASIVNNIRKKVFYLIPPKPSSAPDIKLKIKSLMEQQDLFG